MELDAEFFYCFCITKVNYFMIQKLLVKQMLIVLCIAAATVAGHAANFASTGSFKAGYVWQEVGYVGLGN